MPMWSSRRPGFGPDGGYWGPLFAPGAPGSGQMRRALLACELAEELGKEPEDVERGVPTVRTPAVGLRPAGGPPAGALGARR